MWVLCLNNVQCTTFVPGTHRGRRGTGSPGTAMEDGCDHVENRRLPFSRWSKCSYWLSHLSSSNANFSNNELFVIFIGINLFLIKHLLFFNLPVRVWFFNFLYPWMWKGDLVLTNRVQYNYVFLVMGLTLKTTSHVLFRPFPHLPSYCDIDVLGSLSDRSGTEVSPNLFSTEEVFLDY